METQFKKEVLKLENIKYVSVLKGGKAGKATPSTKPILVRIN
jgi:hypothetical protein